MQLSSTRTRQTPKALPSLVRQTQHGGYRRTTDCGGRGTTCLRGAIRFLTRRAAAVMRPPRMHARQQSSNSSAEATALRSSAADLCLNSQPKPNHRHRCPAAAASTATASGVGMRVRETRPRVLRVRRRFVGKMCGIPSKQTSPRNRSVGKKEKITSD